MKALNIIGILAVVVVAICLIAMRMDAVRVDGHLNCVKRWRFRED